MESMSKAGLEEVDMYFLCHQNTISQYISTCPILELCMEAEWRLGEKVAKRWWDKIRLGLEVVWVEERVAEAKEWSE